ncbi:hypothetical protein ACIPLC_18720 [Kitasatospora sp. NPDC086801]|uniref:hypothetical protein n=1 Tax=Kitasatospora sp. NPDC086801 TaxID=3364066 RepID=UPI0037FA346A
MSLTFQPRTDQPSVRKPAPRTASIWELAMRRLVLGLAAVLPTVVLDLVNWWTRTR